MDILHQTLRGSCQVKKNKKIREKLVLVRQHPPTPPIHFFFWKHEKTQKTQETTKFPPKK